jgi:molybdate transport system ATP-binding protein
MDPATIHLAAVVYARGAPLEDILAAVRGRLVGRGNLRLGGVVPRLGPPLSNGRSSLLLDDIGRGDTIVISQDLGPSSSGCILDADGLARARVRIAEAIEARPDVLFLGRFAREETAGRGIREEIGQAVLAGIPCIVAVEEKMMEGWNEFAGDAFVALPAQIEAIVGWVEGLYPPTPSSRF